MDINSNDYLLSVSTSWSTSRTGYEKNKDTATNDILKRYYPRDKRTGGGSEHGGKCFNPGSMKVNEYFM